MRRVFALHARRQFRVRCIDVDSDTALGASARTVEGCEATARLRREATPRDEATALGGDCSRLKVPKRRPSWCPTAHDPGLPSPGSRLLYTLGTSH